MVSEIMSTVRTRWIAAIVLAGFSITLQAEPTSAGPVAPDTPLVKDSTLTLTEADYRQALLGVPARQRPGIERDANTLREFLLELYVERRLAQEAQRLGLLDQPDIQAKLEMARRKVLVNAVVDQFKAGLKPPDFTDLAHEYYLTHRKDYIQPERIRAAHILLSMKCACEDPKGEKRKQAETILAELRGGANFAELAQKYSEDAATAQRGGAMEPLITRGMLVKPFEDAAFALPEPGALSGVVETQYGYHIIRLLERQPETILPFESVKGRIIEKLAGEFQAINYKEFTAQFFPNMDHFNQPAIDALLKPAPAPAAPPSPPAQ